MNGTVAFRSPMMGHVPTSSDQRASLLVQLLLTSHWDLSLYGMFSNIIFSKSHPACLFLKLVRLLKFSKMGNFAKKYQYYLVASTVLTWRENDHVQQFNKNYFRIQIFSCKTDTVHDTPDMVPKSVVSSLNYFLPNTNCTEAEIYVQYFTSYHIAFGYKILRVVVTKYVTYQSETLCISSAPAKKFTHLTFRRLRVLHMPAERTQHVLVSSMRVKLVEKNHVVPNTIHQRKYWLLFFF